MNVRIGFGYDLHRLKRGESLCLGGVTVPHNKALIGHSDGDCVIHAVIDALFGAAGEQDIGRVFPNSDPALEGIRSTELLEQAMMMVRKRGYEVGNVDVVVVAEKPPLAPHIPAMKAVLSGVLGVSEEDVNIKAKTNEGVGAIGRGDAIAAWAVCLVRPLTVPAGGPETRRA